MSDQVIDVIRAVDPCPAELPPPPIEIVRRRLHDERFGPESDEPFGAELPAARRRPSLGAFAVILSSAVAVAVAVSAIVLGGHVHRAGSPAARGAQAVGTVACRPHVQDAVLPTWARGGFSDARPRMPYALGDSGRIAAILWGALNSPPAADRNNKILAVSRVALRPGGDLTIRAQRMVGTDRLGNPVSRTVTGGPGPSIIDLPAPGCWRLTAMVRTDRSHRPPVHTPRLTAHTS